MKIEAVVPELDNEKITCEVDLGDTLDAAKALFGEEVAYNAYLATAVIRAQGYMRAQRRKGKTAVEIADAMKTWKLSQQRVSGEAGVSSILKKFAKLAPEKQKELISKFLAAQDTQ